MDELYELNQGLQETKEQLSQLRDDLDAVSQAYFDCDVGEINDSGFNAHQWAIANDLKSAAGKLGLMRQLLKDILSPQLSKAITQEAEQQKELKEGL